MKTVRRGTAMDVGDLPMVDVICARADLARMAKGLWEGLSARIAAAAKPLLTFIDVFAGIGGFHTALKMLGLECVFACEKEPRCRATYLLNHGILPAGDIYRVPAEQVPSHDIGLYGIPCQAWSQSGSQGGTDDPRGVLHLEMLRLVGHHRPKVVLAENVRGFLSLHEGPAFQEIVRALEGWGYVVHHEVLNASGYGVPQNRQRLYIVAIRRDAMVQPFHFPKPKEHNIELASVLEPPNLTYKSATTIREYRRVPSNKVRWDRIGKGLIKLGDVNDNTQGDRIYSPRGYSVTLTASTGGWGAGMGLYLVDGVIRRLTPREAARCMGFPESFRFLCAPRVAGSQLGNAVVVNVVEAIAREVFRAVGQALPQREDAPFDSASTPPKAHLPDLRLKNVPRRSKGNGNSATGRNIGNSLNPNADNP